MNQKRGNIFENLRRLGEETATTLTPAYSDVEIKDFDALKDKLNDIQRNSSEVMKDLSRLRNQVEDLKRHLEELDDDNHYDEDGNVLSKIDESLFRLTNLNLKDENRDLFRDHEDEEGLWDETRKIAEIAQEIGFLIVKKREEKKDQEHLDEPAEEKGDWVFPRRRKRRTKASWWSIRQQRRLD